MALKNFRGKTFVAFIDISGFKGMMKKETAGKALSDFFQIGYNTLSNNTNVSGVFISDCGIIYHSEENTNTFIKLEEILKVIKKINQDMIDRNYVLTCSIAYGDFEYQDKIELPNMTKNALQGNAYLDAYIDNEHTTPKLKVGECRVIIPDELKHQFENDREILERFNLKKKGKHYYFYWMLRESETIESYESKIKQIENRFTEKTNEIRDEKFEKLKDVIKGR